MSTIQTTETVGRMTEIREIERKIADLTVERENELALLLRDLEWMDVAVHRLDGLGVPTSLRNMPSGTRVHIVRQYAENDTYDRSHAHRLGDCDWTCHGEAGAIVKGGGLQRWRFKCEGEYEYIGTASGKYDLEYLFVEVSD